MATERVRVLPSHPPERLRRWSGCASECRGVLRCPLTNPLKLLLREPASLKCIAVAAADEDAALQLVATPALTHAAVFPQIPSMHSDIAEESPRRATV